MKRYHGVHEAFENAEALQKQCRGRVTSWVATTFPFGGEADSATRPLLTDDPNEKSYREGLSIRPLSRHQLVTCF